LPANWACAGLPPSAQAAGGSSGGSGIPSGVVAGSLYQAGQQLRVYTEVLNVRAQPTTSAANVIAVLARGDFVAILAGPYQAEGVTWWQVQIGDGTVGWIAGAINGAATLGT